MNEERAKQIVGAFVIGASRRWIAEEFCDKNDSLFGNQLHGEDLVIHACRFLGLHFPDVEYCQHCVITERKRVRENGKNS